MKVSPLTSARSIDAQSPQRQSSPPPPRRQGNTEILGEMIERAEREHAERHRCLGKHACHRANAAVASADHDGIDLAALGLRQRPLGGAMQAFAFDESDLGGDAMLRQGCGETAPHIVGKLLAEGAGAGIHQRHDTLHRDASRRLRSKVKRRCVRHGTLFAAWIRSQANLSAREREAKGQCPLDPRLEVQNGE